MLRIGNLCKTYDNGVEALKDVCLEIPNGMFGLVGPNGAGKSTLMRTIATLQEADSGSVFLDSLDVLRDKPAVRRFLGYLPQEFGVYPRISALRLLDHLAVLNGLVDRRQRGSEVEGLLRMTNLWEVRHQKLGTFSGGMRQRFGIAQALLGSPRLIVVDEPTAGLDPEERRRFLNLLSEIGEDVVVILSTHIIDDVREICTSMAIINRGRVLATGSPGQLINELDGRIWQAEVDTTDVDRCSASTTVVSKRRLGGRTLLRARSDSPPGEGFFAVEPNLEDAYLVSLNADRLPSGLRTTQGATSPRNQS